MKIWADLADTGNLFEKKALQERMAKENVQNIFATMLEEIEEGEEVYQSLSALGSVYWEAYHAQNPDATLKPAPISARCGCKFAGDHHYPKHFKDYVRRVYGAFDWISGCHTKDYSGQRAIKRNRFYIKGRDLIGEYTDKNNFGARFKITTNAENDLERQWCLRELESWLKK